jgi:hypothetical protein
MAIEFNAISFLRSRNETEESGLYELVELREYQKEIWQSFLENDDKYLALSMSRRLGKDMTVLRNLDLYCQNNPRVTILYLFITQEQAITMINSYLADEQRSPYLGAVIDTTKLESTVKSGWLHNGKELRYKNGSKITFSGVGNSDSLVSTNIDMVVFSEAGPMGAKFEELIGILGASMSLTGGRIIAISTPRYGSYFNTIFLDNNKAWNRIVRPYDSVTLDNGDPIFNDKVIARFKASMSIEKFAQEFECNMDMANEVSIYGVSVNMARSVEEVELIKEDQLFVSFDLGVSDSTVMNFSIKRNEKIVLIDSYEENNKPTQHFIDVLNDKINDLGLMKKNVLLIMPHDVANRQDGLTRLVSRASYYIQAGFKVIRLRPLPVNLLIECLRTCMQKGDILFEDTPVIKLILRKLKEYEYKRDTSTGEIIYIPNHGKGKSASNLADSLEYLVAYFFYKKYIDSKKKIFFEAINTGSTGSSIVEQDNLRLGVATKIKR